MKIVTVSLWTVTDSFYMRLHEEKRKRGAWFMYQVFSTTLMLCLFFCFVCISIMAMQKPSNNQKILLVTSVCAFISCFGYFYELKSTTRDAIIICIKIGYLGKVFAIFLFTTFVKNYSNIHTPRWITRIMYLFYVAILYMILTCERHNLYYSSIGIVEKDGYMMAVLEKGPFYYVYLVSVVFVTMFLIIVSVQKVRSHDGYLKHIYTFLSFTGGMPMLGFL